MNTSKGIEKFNGQNFHLFKLRLQLLMKGKGLWDIFTGVDLYNAAHGAPAQLAWKNKDNKAFRILGELLDDSHLPLIQSATDSFQAWTLLKGIYEAPTPINKQFLRRAFVTCKMEEGSSLAAYLEKILGLAAQLESVGIRPADEDIVSTTLLGLPNIYSSLVISLEGGAAYPSIQELRVRFLSKDLKNKNSTTADAFAASTHHLQ